ncbi:hypothetical protein Q4557_19325 [Shewanella sp. 5_MG-2023]|uniref:hypothetical protein n=1 Tax=Shewanella sp. 5_MG-2023 TaxID=3062656 RepID=UPI0026E4540E|nr:hypothetical protein [Shewanella sp. 5_MG-2023]MDO6642107.1 hypothetical protein [Shewanella sp. 5_MG-2023]
MDKGLKDQAEKILKLGIAKIVQNYTKNALLINACYVSSSRYETLTDTNGLSTTQNIPITLRLDQEIDYQYTNEELVEEYKTDVLDVILKNYVVMSISIVDGILEDLYELFLSNIEEGISDSELSKRVRSAWANDNILNYFVAEDKAGLKKPDDMNTPFIESFTRYKELRLIRHSLVHTDGVISQKNMDSLNEYKEQTPDERKGFSLIDSPMIQDGNKVSLSINIILSIRQYLHRFLVYQFKSVSNA